jgi:ribose-phosphate pyrophosphokinase
MSGTPLLFSTRSYTYLRDALSQRLGWAPGQVEISAFPDGERYQRIQSPVADRDAVLVGGTISDTDTLELFDLACALVKYGARELTLVVPYYGYSTMERATKPGEVVTAKTRARLLSAIPRAPFGNRILHLYAKPVIMDLARKLGGPDLVLACTDAGRAKWVESLANEMQVPASFVFKRRLDGSRTEVTAVSAQVQGRDVVIYDDMIRTGSSLLNAAKAYRDAGARKLTALCTHGLFPTDALDRIHGSGLFSAIACTDTHPRALELAGPRLQVASVAELLSHALHEAR